MATPAQAATPQSSRSFAGLLEEYATPQKKFPPSRDLDLLDEDVATLSYEHALRRHARYGPETIPDSRQDDAAKANQPMPLISREEPQALPRTLALAATASGGRMSASVTVRLTSEENDRMRTRAAEAGLTISAYLRSCTFEVENLRAQVKEAVARLREAEQRPAPARHRFWLPRFLRRSPDRQQLPLA